MRRHCPAEAWVAGSGFELPAPVRMPLPGTEIDTALPTGALERPVRTCPIDRPWRQRIMGAGVSAALHLGLAATAWAFLPPLALHDLARGGDEQVTDVVIIGAEDLSAAEEGARSKPASLVLPEVPTTIPATDPSAPDTPAEMVPSETMQPATLPALPPIAETVQQEAEVAPSIEPASPQQPVQLAALAPSPAPQPRVPDLPKAAPPAPQPKAAKLPQPAKRDTPPVRVASINPTARGVTGAGESTANRAASARGGSGGTASSAGSAVMSSYRARVVAHLTRFKSYPEQAQERGINGRNAVTITLQRDGRVSASSLSGGSGHSILDAATLAALRRAQPFPAMPEGGPATFTLTIGMNYDLR